MLQRLLSYVAAVALLIGVCLAQDYRGKLQGVVTDPGGAAIAGAQVVLRNTGTGVDASRETGPDGRYVFDFVESGQYTVAVEAPGFKRFEQRSITVQNRADITVDAHLAIGGITESITVEASPVAVQFNSSSDTTTIGRELIDQMPIRGRNPYNVMTLDPTINGGEASENRPYHHAFANEFDAGGQTTRSNDIQLDGVPLTSSYKTSYTPSIEAVGEVSFQKNCGFGVRV
jgi:Carboxypeptidase regulatory-like domain